MSKFDVGDKVKVCANPFWHFGSRKRWNFIADRAGMTGEVVTGEDASGDYRVKFSDNAFWISSKCLTLVPEPAKSPPRARSPKNRSSSYETCGGTNPQEPTRNVSWESC